MRRVLSTLAAGVLFAVPAAVLAQAQPPNVRTIPPVKRAHPMPTGNFAHRPSRRYQNSYPVVIDGSVIDRYLATPGPAPKRTPSPHPKNYGQDVFETHSSDDAK